MTATDSCCGTGGSGAGMTVFAMTIVVKSMLCRLEEPTESVHRCVSGIQ